MDPSLSTHSFPGRPVLAQVPDDMAAPLRADVALLDDHVLVLLEGDVDMASWPILTSVRDELQDHLLPVVVDASRVAFMDCEGLRAVLSLSPDARRVSFRTASRAVELLLDAALQADLLSSRQQVPSGSGSGPRTGVRVPRRHLRTAGAF